MHSVYPHMPGYLIECPECEFKCHCGPGVMAGNETECVFIGHDTDNWRAATDDETADYLAGYISLSDNVRESDHGIEIREG